MADEDTILDGQIAELDVIERNGTFDKSGVPGLVSIDSEATGEMEIDFFQVRSPDNYAKSKFAILFNTHPKDRALGNTWGFQLCDTDGDGVV